MLMDSDGGGGVVSFMYPWVVWYSLNSTWLEVDKHRMIVRIGARTDE